MVTGSAGKDRLVTLDTMTKDPTTPYVAAGDDVTVKLDFSPRKNVISFSFLFFSAFFPSSG